MAGHPAWKTDRQRTLATSEALARYFTDAAAFLRGTGSAPALATLGGVIDTVPPDSVLADDAPSRPR